ncbi:catechol 2,3-dioxygenase-like lactoylglutathione lyase family enzyme [Microbacterium proteolyticum]|uniref:Catechol 2,3-dioxygenase-like lactoylglutathione lyase family enzyme n=1 Tax=Microbacterium proteolyticum TaxID=1572644 RepID=A0A7W5CKA3_9MICO|nr:VOC family protein [Microbacterium proteolyticum]MBB3158775.1 catechol 2,3-dioxygenase-like lactoylglutathione lyase family enzyme [Microbacterium proteolyticum]
MDMKLELIPLPVSDVSRSKGFSVDALDFPLDHDVEPGNGMRIVEVTPPGSACSTAFGTGMTRPDAGPVHGIHLVVDDIAAVRRGLRARGVDIGAIRDLDGVAYASFSDPDGNTWELPSLRGPRVS